MLEYKTIFEKEPTLKQVSEEIKRRKRLSSEDEYFREVGLVEVKMFGLKLENTREEDEKEINKNG